MFLIYVEVGEPSPKKRAKKERAKKRRSKYTEDTDSEDDDEDYVKEPQQNNKGKSYGLVRRGGEVG